MAIDLARIQGSEQSAREAPLKEVPAQKKAQPSLLRKLLSLEIGGRHNVSLNELVLFARQLALLLETGNGLVPSILSIAPLMHGSKLEKVLKQVGAGLEEGRGLSESLGLYPDVFDTFFVSILRTGEASGSLRKSLDRLAAVLETRQRLRSRVMEAMTYPIVLTVIMAAVVIFMLTYMFPRFSVLFAGLTEELPWNTRLLLGSGELLRSRWWLVLPIAVLVGVGARRLWRVEPVRRTWDAFKLRLPIAGALYTEAYMFQLFSSLGLLLESRVPHLEAFEIARHAINNASFDGFFDNLAEHVEAGRGVAPAFQESKFLPSTVKLMVSTGETSGALDTVMARLSHHYREELERDIRRLSSLIEPIMLVVMGLMVGFIVVSFIVPLFKLSRAIH